MEGVGGEGREGGQTGALKLSGIAQSGVGRPARNCLFIPCQRDLHISMSQQHCQGLAAWGTRDERNTGEEECRGSER